MPANPVTLREAQLDDFAAILALNDESVHFLSPLSAVRLEALNRSAAYHKVVDVAGEIAAFLLAFREGAPYDSPNYLWFVERYPHFLYVDRIVVAAAHRGSGLGAMQTIGDGKKRVSLQVRGIAGAPS